MDYERSIRRLNDCKRHGLTVDQTNFAMGFLRDMTEEEFANIKADAYPAQQMMKKSKEAPPEPTGEK